MLGLARKIQDEIGVNVLTDPVEVRDNWRSTLTSDETADDSDKTFTVPASAEWQILNIWVEYTSDGTAGNRQLVIELLDDSSDVIGRVIPAITQAASLSREYEFAPSLADLTAERDTTWLMTPSPPTWILPAGFGIRIYDNNAVAAAGDDMIVQMLIGVRTV